MKTTMDKAGRVVVPRALRGQVGLIDGGEVELEVEGGVIRIEPLVGHEVVEEQGLLVIPGAGLRLDDDTVRSMRHADQR